MESPMCLGIPGRVENITDDTALTRRGQVRFAGIVKEVNLALVPEARVGDYVVVHAGFGISVIDEERAHSVLRFLSSTGDLEIG